MAGEREQRRAMGERWELSDDELIDNAAGCSQFRPLMDETDESLRECIKLNVCEPLRQRIAALEAERDEARAYVRAALQQFVDENYQVSFDLLRKGVLEFDDPEEAKAAAERRRRLFLKKQGPASDGGAS